MPHVIASILAATWFRLLTRVLLTLVFWSAGLAGVFDFKSIVAEMAAAGLAPAPAYATAVTTLLLLLLCRSF